MSNQHSYPKQDPASTGMKGRCPRCGEGDLFRGLQVKDACTACGLDYSFSDSGDGPTVFIILGLGFLMLCMALYVELTYEPSIWLHVILWPPVLLIIGLPALRVAKGMMIAQQYATDASSGVLKEEN